MRFFHIFQTSGPVHGLSDVSDEESYTDDDSIEEVEQPPTRTRRSLFQFVESEDEDIISVAASGDPQRDQSPPPPAHPLEPEVLIHQTAPHKTPDRVKRPSLKVKTPKKTSPRKQPSSKKKSPPRKEQSPPHKEQSPSAQRGSKGKGSGSAALSQTPPWPSPNCHHQLSLIHI